MAFIWLFTTKDFFMNPLRLGRMAQFSLMYINNIPYSKYLYTFLKRKIRNLKTTKGQKGFLLRLLTNIVTSVLMT